MSSLPFWSVVQVITKFPEEAIATENQDLSTQTAWGNWDGQIIADIVRRHEAEGGQVVFYDMPLSSYFQRTYATTTRAVDRTVFTKWEDQIGTPHVHPHFATSDAEPSCPSTTNAAGGDANDWTV